MGLPPTSTKRALAFWGTVQGASQIEVERYVTTTKTRHAAKTIELHESIISGSTHIRQQREDNFDLV